MNYGEWLRLMKPYAKCSYEKLLNEAISCIVDTCDLKMKNGKESLYFDKSYTSKIVNNHINLPPVLVKASINNERLPEFIEASSDFYKRYINENHFPELRNLFTSQLSNDTSFSESEKTLLLSISDNIEFFVSIMLKTMLIDNISSTNTATSIWNRGNSYIRVITGDIFKYAFANRRKRKTIVVIPVNTKFDTHLSTKLEKTTNPLVSGETLHGEWLLRLKKRNMKMDDVKQRILDDLSHRHSNCNNDGEYPIGTIATVVYDNACFYLLAISIFDENNRAVSCPQYIEEAIDKLLNFYDINGQGYELYIPLLGTGRSRAGLTYPEAFDLLSRKLINKSSTVHGKIIIVISTDAANQLSIGGKNK